MPRIEIIEVDETELESLVANNPKSIADALEKEDIKVLGKQVQTDTGPLDILALDEEGTLLVIELKVAEDENQLDQGLRYFDWVTSNREWIARAYSGEKINVERNPQLVLIAPSFSKNLQRIAKYIDEDVGLSLLTFDVVKPSTVEKSVICKPLGLERPPEARILPTEESVLGAIKNEKIRQLCSNCLNDIKGLSNVVLHRV